MLLQVYTSLISIYFAFNIPFMKLKTLPLIILLILISCNQHGSKKSVSGNEKKNSRETESILSVQTACLLSEISYCPDPEKEIKQFMPGWKLVWNPEEVGGNYAYIATDGNTYALAIRGSMIQFNWAAFDNWIYNDLNVASQKDWPYGNNGGKSKISKGAYEGWLNMNKLTDKTSGKNLLLFLKENVEGKKPILITGHSLGGNLAAVYASYIRNIFQKDNYAVDNINVITFAAPAAGNKAFADDFDASFPNSVRVENTNDIVPKFPVTGKIRDLGNLYSPSPDASAILVGYKNATTKLSAVFTMINAALDLLEITTDLSSYYQTNGTGNLITVKLSGKNNSNDISGWFGEAGYQHGIEQYATALGATKITCKSE